MKYLIVLLLMVPTLASGQWIDSISIDKKFDIEAGDTVAYWVRTVYFANEANNGPVELDSIEFEKDLLDWIGVANESIYQIQIQKRLESHWNRLYRDLDGMYKDLTGETFENFTLNDRFTFIKAGEWKLKTDPDSEVATFTSNGNKNGRVESKSGDWFRIAPRGSSRIFLKGGLFKGKPKEFFLIRDGIDRRGRDVTVFKEVDGSATLRYLRSRR